jgi:hypothetical protein
MGLTNLGFLSVCATVKDFIGWKWTVILEVYLCDSLMLLVTDEL